MVHQEVMTRMYAKVARLQEEAGGDQEDGGDAAVDAAAQGASPRSARSDGDAPAAAPDGGDGASPACLHVRDPTFQRMCDGVLQRFPLLDALDKVDLRPFAYLQHTGVREFAAEWRAQMSELALLVSCGGHTDMSRQVFEVLSHCLRMAKVSFLLNPVVMMQLVGFNIVTGQHEAPPGPEHWRAVVAAIGMSEAQVALTKTLVGFVGPRVAAAERKRQQVAQAAGAPCLPVPACAMCCLVRAMRAKPMLLQHSTPPLRVLAAATCAADTASSMLSALSSDGGGSMSSFRSSGSAFRSMLGELEKHSRTWRVESPMVGAIAYLLEPHQLAALFLRAMPWYAAHATATGGRGMRGPCSMPLHCCTAAGTQICSTCWTAS